MPNTARCAHERILLVFYTFVRYLFFPVTAFITVIIYSCEVVADGHIIVDCSCDETQIEAHHDSRECSIKRHCQFDGVRSRISTAADWISAHELMNVIALKKKSDGTFNKSHVSNAWFHTTNSFIENSSALSKDEQTILKQAIRETPLEHKIPLNTTHEIEGSFFFGIPVQGVNVGGSASASSAQKVHVVVTSQKSRQLDASSAGSIEAKAVQDLIQNHPDIKGRLPKRNFGSSRDAIGVITYEQQGKIEVKAASSFTAATEMGVKDMAGVKGILGTASSLEVNADQTNDTIAAKLRIYPVERRGDNFFTSDPISILDGGDCNALENIKSWVAFGTELRKKYASKRPILDIEIENEPKQGFVAPLPSVMDPVQSFSEAQAQAFAVVSNATTPASSRKTSLDLTSSNETSSTAILHGTQLPGTATEERLLAANVIDKLARVLEFDSDVSMVAPYDYTGSHNVVVEAPHHVLAKLFLLLQKSPIQIDKSWQLTSMTPAFQFDPDAAGFLPIKGPSNCKGMDFPAGILRIRGQILCILPVQGADRKNTFVETIYDHGWEVASSIYSIPKHETKKLDSMLAKGYEEILDEDMLRQEGVTLLAKQELHRVESKNKVSDQQMPSNDLAVKEDDHEMAKEDEQSMAMAKDDDDDDDNSSYFFEIVQDELADDEGMGAEFLEETIVVQIPTPVYIFTPLPNLLLRVPSSISHGLGEDSVVQEMLTLRE